MKTICRFKLMIFLLSFLAFGFQANETQKKIDLSGTWLFSRDEAKVGLTEKWYEEKLKTVGSGPSEIALPGTTDEAKAGLPNPKKPSLDGLYRPNIYTGPAWYQREVDIPSTWKGKHITLFLERLHWVTHLWLDGQDFGMHDNLISPQVYDLGINVTPGKHRLTICVDNTLKFNLGRFVSINYEGTQTNWNGIVGAINLCADDPVSLSNVEVYPDMDRKLIKVEARISNVTGSPVSGDVQFSVVDAAGAIKGATVSAPFSASNRESVVTMEVPMGNNPKLWDEFSPNLYVLKTSLSTKKTKFISEKSVSFGMRKLAIQGTMFTMNGRPLMLRGTLDCAIYPLTAYPPTDVASWSRIYKIMKSYGLNFIRFHSWTPPDAAFTAADQEGVMIQTEGPQANTPAGKIPQQDAYMEQELMGIIHAYGNHPSFCLMTLGNEYGGADSVLTHWVDMLIKSDPRHLYSSASSSQVTTNRQWTENGTGRGIHGPGTMSDVLVALTRQDIPRPIIGHEIGQWTFYPNFDEIKKYTGVLKAKNFELVRDSLKANGMLDEARPFFQSTGQQAVLLYKEEIELLLRTPGYAGFSLLDLHDYPGQGTALIGLLDPFWDSKGFITPEEHKRYCGATVPLLRIPKRTYTTIETFSAKAEVAHFGAADLPGAQPEWSIRGENGQLIANGSLAKLNLPTGKLTELGDINAPLNIATTPGKFIVTVSLKNTSFYNSWDIWVYPPPAPTNAPNNVTVSHRWDESTRKALAEGKRVVLFPDTLNSAYSLKGSFLPVFWSPIWFHRMPNTMGILCDPKNQLFSQFPTDAYSNWQWWNLIQGSQTMILNETPAAFRPLIQVIDNFDRNYKLGNVFEARVGKGSLLVCSLNLKDEKLPETAAFLKSLYVYAGSNSFKPDQELDFATLDKILSR
jgi:Glycosyl hydrolases family 2, sugar binding domain/Glycosyl hydrolases family 2